MAILWMDGFAHYGTSSTRMTEAGWVVAGASPTTSSPRTGTHCLDISNSSASARRSFGGPKSTVGVGAAIKLAGWPGTSTGGWVLYDAALGSQLTLSFNLSGYLELRRGSSGGTLLATSSAIILAGLWQHLEIKAVIDNTAGSVEVRLNGVTVLSVSGVDTQATANAEVSFITFNGYTSGLTIADAYAWDTSGSVNTDFIGDQRVYTRFVNADTATENWTPSTGTDSYAVVDEATPSDADYLSAASAMTTVLGLPALAGTVTTVKAIQTVHRSLKSEAGLCSMRGGVVSSGVAGNGATVGLSISAGYYNDVFNTDPNTSAAWTASAASAVQAKIERVS